MYIGVHIIYGVHITQLPVADPGGVGGRPGLPPYLRTKLRPEGPKPDLPLSKGLDDRQPPPFRLGLA